jgi:hypothetical protein
MLRIINIGAGLLAIAVLPGAQAGDLPNNVSPDGADEVCAGFAPQAPRDLQDSYGENVLVFPFAPRPEVMNVCNIHFHRGAEHRAAEFAESDDHGGYRCMLSARLSEAERAPLEVNACGDVGPGDTIEVHWVYSSCDVAPGSGLGACSSPRCSNPSLRVESQVFTLVNSDAALDFASVTDLVLRGGFHQPAAMPSGAGEPVRYLGSTTGPSYDRSVCSPLQVSWSVRPQCAKLDAASLSRWCAGNPFAERHAHGVRMLVVDPQLLAPMQSP